MSKSHIHQTVLFVDKARIDFILLESALNDGNISYTGLPPTNCKTIRIDLIINFERFCDTSDASRVIRCRHSEQQQLEANTYHGFIETNVPSIEREIFPTISVERKYEKKKKNIMISLGKHILSLNLQDVKSLCT